MIRPELERVKWPFGMAVDVAHVPNPDVPCGGYWGHPIDPGTRKRAEVASVAQAIEVVARYIARNGLGGGNWPTEAGAVWEFEDEDDDHGRFIGRIAYNGRFIPAEGGRR